MCSWIIPARAGFTPRSARTLTGTRDHPRSRGVYTNRSHAWALNRGSSPLARGLRRFCRAGAWWCGIIPARAGFTSGVLAGASNAWDHPRSRGVYPATRRRLSPSLGSSPLARGLRAAVEDDGAAARIIPARAGFTTAVRFVHWVQRDHPRSRGVYLVSAGVGGGGGGIIPARAGFTTRGRVAPRMAGDHPRSRGVYFSMSSRRLHTDGSSPLARGLLVVVSGRVFSCGIIPARAGFTDTLSCHNRLVGDHPRSRGVYGPWGSPMWWWGGSSPLARGLRARRVVLRPGRGIIPARAGFTCVGGHSCGVARDHPRSRGVYTWRSLESQRCLTLPDGCCLHC